MAVTPVAALPHRVASRAFAPVLDAGIVMSSRGSHRNVQSAAEHAMFFSCDAQAMEESRQWREALYFPGHFRG